MCGLPYTRMRDAGAPIEPLAAPVPEDEDGSFYRADLLVAPGVRETAPEQLRGARVAFNGDDSLSGWVMPRHALRELGIDPDSYVWVRTGSHRNSLRALLRGEVEAAPIDSTVLALELRADPALASLRTLARLGHMPSPPVALVGGDASLAESLRTALTGLGASDGGSRRWSWGRSSASMPSRMRTTRRCGLRTRPAEAASRRGAGARPCARPRMRSRRASSTGRPCGRGT